MTKRTTKTETMSAEHSLFLSKQRQRSRIIITFRLLILGFIIIAWEAAAHFGFIDAFIFSSPSRILKTIKMLYDDGSIWVHSYYTIVETVISFVLATAIGTAIAILLWMSDMLRKISDPFIVVLNSLPKIALGPIIIVWVGAGLPAIIVMAILICVIITTLNMLAAFRSCDKEKILMLRSMGATKLQILGKLVLPHSLPAFISVLKINVGMAWVGTIMGEYLSSSAGLGYLIIYGGQVFKLDLVMASTVPLCAYATLMYFAVVLLEKLLVYKK